MRRHEDEANQPLRALIHDSVHFAGFGQDGFAGLEGYFFVAGAKRAFAFEDDHHLVFVFVEMSGLRLPRFQTIEVTKEARRLEEIVLPHLCGVEFAQFFEVDDFHSQEGSRFSGIVHDMPGILYLCFMDTSAPDPNGRWIRIVLHARAAELSGESEVHIQTSPAATVRDLKSAIGSQVPKLAAILASSAIATDTDYLSDSALLGDETSLHLIPPVSGG